MTLSLTTEDEIKSIKELKTNQTTGPNCIPIKILNKNKKQKNELAKTSLCPYKFGSPMQVHSLTYLKLQKLFQFTKKETPWNATTIILFHYYQI